jgi:hypothetical protein
MALGIHKRLKNVRAIYRTDSRCGPFCGGRMSVRRATGFFGSAPSSGVWKVTGNVFLTAFAAAGGVISLKPASSGHFKTGHFVREEIFLALKNGSQRISLIVRRRNCSTLMSEGPND